MTTAAFAMAHGVVNIEASALAPQTCQSPSTKTSDTSLMPILSSNCRRLRRTAA
jgi:hypothetical protein